MHIYVSFSPATVSQNNEVDVLQNYSPYIDSPSNLFHNGRQHPFISVLFSKMAFGGWLRKKDHEHNENHGYSRYWIPRSAEEVFYDLKLPVL